MIKKTESNHVRYQGATNCSIGKAYRQMKDTKDLFGRKGSIKGYHIIQSFAPNEIEHQTAYKIAQEFVREYLRQYEVVFSTHVDKQHIHNHITFNSVSFVDGKSIGVIAVLIIMALEKLVIDCAVSMGCLLLNLIWRIVIYHMQSGLVRKRIKLHGTRLLKMI